MTKQLSLTLTLYAFALSMLSAQMLPIDSSKDYPPKSSYIEDEDDEEQEEETVKEVFQFNVVPALVGAFDDELPNFIPSISAVLSGQTMIKFFYSNATLRQDIGVFTSSVRFDTSSMANGFNFLTREASNYGIQYHSTIGFIENNAPDHSQNSVFNLHVDLSLLGKQIPKVRNGEPIGEAAQMMTFHGYLGIEAFLWERLVSVYAGGNYLFNIAEVESYKAFFNKSSGTGIGYFEFGFNLFLSPGKDYGIADLLLLNLGAIANRDSIETFVNTKDPITPRFKIAYIRTLDFENRIRKIQKNSSSMP